MKKIWILVMLVLLAVPGYSRGKIEEETLGSVIEKYSKQPMNYNGLDWIEWSYEFKVGAIIGFSMFDQGEYILMYNTPYYNNDDKIFILDWLFYNTSIPTVVVQLDEFYENEEYLEIFIWEAIFIIYGKIQYYDENPAESQQFEDDSEV